MEIKMNIFVNTIGVGREEIYLQPWIPFDARWLMKDGSRIRRKRVQQVGRV